MSDLVPLSLSYSPFLAVRTLIMFVVEISLTNDIEQSLNADRRDLRRHLTKLRYEQQ